MLRDGLSKTFTPAGNVVDNNLILCQIVRRALEAVDAAGGRRVTDTAAGVCVYAQR